MNVESQGGTVLMVGCSKSIVIRSGNLELFARCWLPEQFPSAMLTIIHGLGGHSGQFYAIAQALIPKGFGVCGLDLRGHGRSPGERGFINHWSEFRDDVTHFLAHIRQQQPGCPLFLLGHSLGGVVVLDYAIRQPEGLQGVIVTAPALGPVAITPWKLVLGQLLSRVWPQFSLSTGIDLSPASRDPAVLQTYARDPLRHERGTARLSTEFLTATRWVHDHAPDLDIPLLILHGGADRVVPVEGSQLFFEQVTFPDKTRHVYPNSYHELHNDLDSPIVLADLATWMETRRTSPPYHPLP